MQATCPLIKTPEDAGYKIADSQALRLGEYLNKTDTILDFLQMIFKVIIQNLQTSNTSASQNNNKRQHQKTIRIFEAEKISWVVGFSKTKTRDTDVIPQGGTRDFK